MSATYAGFLAASSRDVVVLVELTPSLTIQESAWTTLDAPTQYYATGLDPFVAADAESGVPQAPDYPNGIYRRVVGVRLSREGETLNLTERLSVAQVQTNASSFFHDRANHLLYIRTGGQAIAAYTAVQVFVRFYVATRGIVLNLPADELPAGAADVPVYHHPWLTGAMPRLSEHVEDALYGSKIVEGGTVELLNGHGFWHRVVANDSAYNWKNKTVRFLLGGSYNGLDLARAEYADVLTLLVDDISANESVCTVALRPRTSQLDVTVPPTPIFAADFPNLGDGVEGTRKWIGFGRATIKADLVDTTVSFGKYLIADNILVAGIGGPVLQAIHAVYAVSKATGQRTPITSLYTPDLTNGFITINDATYSWQNYDIAVDVTGRALTTAADIVKALLTIVAGVAAADIDTASFDQATIDAPQELSLWIKEPRSLRSLLSSDEGYPSIERSVMGRLSQNRLGKWKFNIWTPGYDASTAISLSKADFAAFEPDPKVEAISTRTLVHYNYNHLNATWTVDEDRDRRREYLLESIRSLEIYTFLRNASDAALLAARYQFIAAAIGLEIEFDATNIKLADVQGWDKVLVTYAPAATKEGAFIRKPFEIIRLDRGLGPTFQVAGRLGDLRGVGHLVGRWMDSAAPNWAAATAEQRTQSGFWSDSNGYVDPADLATLNISRWW